MDRRERIAEQLTSVNALLRGLQAKMWTTMPGILQTYDPVKRTATVQVAIQPQTRDPYGTWTNQSISVLQDCPVQFPRGGGYGFRFPLVEGDEGLVHFSARCIDAWWQNGGVQPQAEFRMHDLSDGFFVPGVCSVPNAPADDGTNTARFWAEDGSVYVDLDKTAGTIKLHALTTIVDGNLVITGTASQQVGGGGTIDFGDTNLKTTGSVTQGTVVLGTHTHPVSGSETGEPNP